MSSFIPIESLYEALCKDSFEFVYDQKDLDTVKDLVQPGLKSTNNFTAWLKPRVKDPETGKLTSNTYDCGPVVVCTDANVYSENGGQAVSTKASLTFRELTDTSLNGICYVENLTDEDNKDIASEAIAQTNLLCSVINKITEKWLESLNSPECKEALNALNTSIKTHASKESVNVSNFTPTTVLDTGVKFHRVRLIGASNKHSDIARQIVMFYNIHGGNKKGTRNLTPVLYTESNDVREEITVGSTPVTVDNVGTVIPKETLIEYLVFNISNMTVKATPKLGTVMMSLDIQVVELVNPRKPIRVMKKLSKRNRASQLLNRKPAPAPVVETVEEAGDEEYYEDNFTGNGEENSEYDAEDPMQVLNDSLKTDELPEGPPELIRQNAGVHQAPAPVEEVAVESAPTPVTAPVPAPAVRGRSGIRGRGGRGASTSLSRNLKK
jgi:hypothetical protein